MAFEIDVGHASAAGKRAINEDFASVHVPNACDESRGWLIAIADGVSMGGRGREAAQSTVMGLMSDYYATPSTWEISVALDRLIEAQNAWWVGCNRRWQGCKGPAPIGMTTLTAMVLRGQTFTVAHVGDTRAALLRGEEWTYLTQDHSLDHLDFGSRLTRAVGLDECLSVDSIQGELRVGDTLVLTTDGVHRALSESQLKALVCASPAQSASEALIQAALTAGSLDNVTAVVLRIQGLAPPLCGDALIGTGNLPVPGRLKVGDQLDGMGITALVADTGVHRIYQARIDETRQLVAVKTLHESRASDLAEREMLAHEIWLGQQLNTQWSGQGDSGFVRVHKAVGASAFYAVFDWHSGHTLAQRLARGERFEVADVLRGVMTMAKALGRLHRQGVVHRDIKPDNLHCSEDDGQWRILDLGVAVSGHEPAAVRALHAGTPSYMNPEQWADPPMPADARSDLFALGITLYQWLTGRLPYGNIEPFQLGAFRRDPRAPSRWRPDVPIWLDHIILKAIALDPNTRFETAEEFVLALERGAARPLPTPGSTPLAMRDPTALWKIGLILSMLLNMLLIFWLFFLPKG